MNCIALFLEDNLCMLLTIPILCPISCLKSRLPGSLQVHVANFLCEGEEIIMGVHMLRDLIEELDHRQELVHVKKPVDTNLEMAAVINALDERPVLFENVKQYKGFKVIAGVCSRREIVARALGCRVNELLKKLAHAIKNPIEPDVVSNAPCQELIIKDVDLNALPILYHLQGDGGRYTTASIGIIKDPETGRNMSYHRLMQIGKNRFAARLVKKRQVATTYEKTPGELEIAICIGNSMATLIAASLGPKPGVDELGIANVLEETPVVKCITKDLEVPANCEIVLEGRLLKEQTDEGPFVDLTETRDQIRKQPVLEIDCITMRRDPIYQALLPGKREHKLLMGMPKEPTIYNEVNKVVRCKNVYVTPGGASWLHAVVQIEKQGDEDGRKAIEAAFRGHGSLKHVVIVDQDIDIYDPHKVEWAIATRVQADRDVIVFKDQPASSLDPSATHIPGQKSRSAKAGVDATKKKTSKSFEPVEYMEINVEDYV